MVGVGQCHRSGTWLRRGDRMKEEDIKIGNWYRVPAQTYEGYVLAKVIGS